MHSPFRFFNLQILASIIAAAPTPPPVGNWDVSEFVVPPEISTIGIVATPRNVIVVNNKIYILLAQPDTRLYTYDKADFDADGTLTLDHTLSYSDGTYDNFDFYNDGFGLLIGAGDSTKFEDRTLSTAYDISTSGTPTVKTINLTGGTAMASFSFSGDYIYLSDGTNDRIVQASWDGSDILNSTILDSFSIPTANQYQAQMNSTGTQFIYTDYSTRFIYQYDLSTAHDLSTATLTKTLDLYTEIGGFIAGSFIYDTYSLYAVSRPVSNLRIDRYDRPIPVAAGWDLRDYVDVPTIEGTYSNSSGVIRSLVVEDSNLYANIANTNSTFYNYNKTTYDTTGTLTATNSLVTTVNTQWGFFFYNNGEKLITQNADATGFKVYTLSTAYDISTAGTATDITNTIATGSSVTYGLCQSGDYIYISDYTNGRIVQANWDGSDISNSSLTATFNISITTPQQLCMNSTGTKLVCADYTTKSIYQYALSTAHDLTTMYYQYKLDVSDSFITDLRGVYIDSESILYTSGLDGVYRRIIKYDAVALQGDLEISYYTKDAQEGSINTFGTNNLIVGDVMYIMRPGASVNYINAYDKDAFDLDGTMTEVYTTLTITSSALYGFAFYNSGSNILVMKTDASGFLSCTLSTAYDISTAGAFTTIAINLTGGSDTRGFSLSGSHIYITDNTNDRIVQASWDGSNIANSTQEDTFTVDATYPLSIQVSSDGKQLTYVGYNECLVYQYDLSTSHDLTTAVFSRVLNLTDDFNLLSGAYMADDILYTSGRNLSSVWKTRSYSLDA